MITVRNLTKAFRGHTVLDSVEFKLPSNSIIGLCGRNGAGKTTLIKLLLSIYNPNEGEVKNLSQHTKVIFDVPPQLNSLKVRDYLNFFALLYRDSVLSDTEVSEILNRVNLGAYKNKRVFQLSYGMKKILYISTLLLGETDLAVVDEPFNGLDPISLSIVKGIFLQVKADNNALILISSHLLNELADICEHFLIVKDADIRYIESISDESKKVRLVCSTPIEPYEILGDLGDITLNTSTSYDIVLSEGTSSADVVRRLYERGIIFREIYYKNVINV